MKSYAILLLLSTLASSSGAQVPLDTVSRGQRVRATLCPLDDLHDGPVVRIGAFAGLDSTTLFLDGAQGMESLPISRLLSLAGTVSPAREFRILGALAGIPLGVVVTLARDTRRPGVEKLPDFPKGIATGVIAGFKVGALFSDSEGWQPLPLPARHATGCSSVIENPGA
jgi:hypothetical protein